MIQDDWKQASVKVTYKGKSVINVQKVAQLVRSQKK